MNPCLHFFGQIRGIKIYPYKIIKRFVKPLKLYYE